MRVHKLNNVTTALTLLEKNRVSFFEGTLVEHVQPYEINVIVPLLFLSLYPSD